MGMDADKYTDLVLRSRETGVMPVINLTFVAYDCE